MKLTAKGRYAVLAMTDVASSDVGACVSLSQIAERQKISQTFLEQLFSRLRRAGLVESVRGPGGGYKLSRDRAAITVGQILIAVDELVQTKGCSSEMKATCTGHTSKCLSHDLWQAMEDHIALFLTSITLDDVVSRRFPVFTAEFPELEAAE